MSPAELARRGGTAQRDTRQWLGARAASGYVDYNAATDSYALSQEQAAAFADESSPAFVAGGFLVALGAPADLERIQHAFLTGEAWAGTSTATTCSRAADGSSSRDTARTC